MKLKPIQKMQNITENYRRAKIKRGITKCKRFRKERSF